MSLENQSVEAGHGITELVDYSVWTAYFERICVIESHEFTQKPFGSTSPPFQYQVFGVEWSYGGKNEMLDPKATGVRELSEKHSGAVPREFLARVEQRVEVGFRDGRSTLSALCFV